MDEDVHRRRGMKILKMNFPFINLEAVDLEWKAARHRFVPGTSLADLRFFRRWSGDEMDFRLYQRDFADYRTREGVPAILYGKVDLLRRVEWNRDVRRSLHDYQITDFVRTPPNRWMAFE